MFPKTTLKCKQKNKSEEYGISNLNVKLKIDVVIKLGTEPVTVHLFL